MKDNSEACHNIKGLYTDDLGSAPMPNRVTVTVKQKAHCNCKDAHRLQKGRDVHQRRLIRFGRDWARCVGG